MQWADRSPFHHPHASTYRAQNLWILPYLESLADVIKDLELGSSRITWMDTECSDKCRYRREVEGDFTAKEEEAV